MSFEKPQDQNHKNHSSVLPLATMRKTYMPPTATVGILSLFIVTIDLQITK